MLCMQWDGQVACCHLHVMYHVICRRQKAGGGVLPPRRRRGVARGHASAVCSCTATPGGHHQGCQTLARTQGALPTLQLKGPWQYMCYTPLADDFKRLRKKELSFMSIATMIPFMLTAVVISSCSRARHNHAACNVIGDHSMIAGGPGEDGSAVAG